jgi:PRTRC genetic system protein B
MDMHIRIGDTRNFALKHAVLLYQEGNRAFATLHEVKFRPDGPAYLCAGDSVTTGFLQTLAKGLGTDMAVEVLPENILARTPDLIAWWSPAQPRLMFFGGGNTEARKLNGKMYPHPSLVFMIHEREMFVRSLGENRRPKSNTLMKNAPYWNTDAQGRVCPGSMRVPEEVSVSTITNWERAFFESEFTHPSGAVRLTTHPSGFLGLWSGLADRKRFPVRFLADSKQTLREFIQASYID